MADETRTVIIEVDVDNTQANNTLIQTNEILEDNKKQLKELRKDYANNSEEINELEQSNRKLNVTKRQAIKETQTEANSLNALRLELAKQTKERNNLNLKTEEGVERFQELQGSIAGLNKEIGGFEQAGGDFRRNVGNYPELLGDAVGGVKIFGTSLSSLFKLIIANPIGLILTALTALVSVFKETQTGAELFRKAGAALSTGLGLLSDIVENLGIRLIEAFENPQEALNDLVDTIKNGIVKYFTEFIPNAIGKVIDGFGLLAKAAQELFAGDFDKALETATEGTIELVDGITDLVPATAIAKTAFQAAVPAISAFADEVDRATSSAFALENQLIANEKALADFEVAQAQSIANQKELNRTIEDQTKSFDDRIAAAEKFAQVEQDQIDTGLKLAQQRVDILERQNELTNSTEEDIQRVRDAQIQLAQLQAASDERALTNENKLRDLRRQQEAERVAALELDQQREADATTRRLEALDKELETKNKLQEQQAKEEAARQRALQQSNVTALAEGFASARTLAGENEELLKGIALTEIGIDTARAISGLVAASESNPTNAVTFGGSAVLQYASGILRIGANIASAVRVLNSGDGSVPTASGGGGASSVASSISGLANVNGSLLGQFSAEPEAGAATANATGRSVADNLPTIQVAVTDINSAQSARDVKVREATL